MSDTPSVSAGSPRRKSSLPLILVVGLVGIGIAGVVYWNVQSRSPAGSIPAEVAEKLTGLGLAPLANKLDAAFVDANGDLVADAPVDPSAWVDPAEILFSYIGDKAGDWALFMGQVSAAVGRPVRYVDYRADEGTTAEDAFEQQLWDLRHGKLHVLGLTTGQVPMAVNVAGFVPVGKVANEKGESSYQIAFAVSAAGPIQSLTSLKEGRGYEMLMILPSSNSGYKAPLILLRDQGILPGKHYSWWWARSNEGAVRILSEAETARSKTSIAPFSSDTLDRFLDKDPGLKEKIRVIARLGSYPRATIGLTHQLKPELAEKLTTAIRSVDLKAAGMAARLGADAAKFAPVDYAKDFAAVIEIDNATQTRHVLVDPKSRPVEEPAGDGEPPVSEPAAVAEPAADQG